MELVCECTKAAHSPCVTLSWLAVACTLPYLPCIFSKGQVTGHVCERTCGLICVAVAACREKLAGLVAARAETHTAIAATMPVGTMTRDFAIQFLAAQECMDALKRNLRSEHVLIHEFLSTFYTQARGRLRFSACELLDSRALLVGRLPRCLHPRAMHACSGCACSCDVRVLLDRHWIKLD